MGLGTAIDKAIAILDPVRAAKRTFARQQIELASSYRGAANNRLFSDWVLGVDDSTPNGWELSELRKRSRDLNRNDPVACGATDTLGINVVGSGLRLQSKIRADVLGVSEDHAKELSRQCEAAHAEWSQTADSGNRLNFDEIQFLALRKVIEDGETIALPTMASEPWRAFSRCIELVESDYLESTGQDFEYGIKCGERGQPLAYSFRKPKGPRKHQYEYTTISARDSRGRPKVIHAYRALRPGQRRGVPYFAPAIASFKHLADYLEAEIVAARVAACLAVFITQNDQWTGMSSNWNETETGTGAGIQYLEPGIVSRLKTGESINTVDPSRPGDSFAPFVDSVLRLIGVSLGLPYELLFKDFSDVNYSSARAALLEGRRMFTGWRTWFAAKFCQPIYELVLEEAWMRGMIDIPDFWSVKSEICRASWIGGAWGWVDPVKEVKTSKEAIDFNLSTLADEAAGQGRDWEETLEQRAKEKARVKELGLGGPEAAPDAEPEAEPDVDDPEQENENDDGSEEDGTDE